MPATMFVRSTNTWIELWQTLATSKMIANPSRIGLVTRAARAATTRMAGLGPEDDITRRRAYLPKVEHTCAPRHFFCRG